MGLERKEMDKAVIFVVKSFEYGKDENGAAASRWNGGFCWLELVIESMVLQRYFGADH